MASAESPPKPGKRLALFFDGTWDVPQNNTNVWRLYLMLAERGFAASPAILLRRWSRNTRSGTTYRRRIRWGLAENVRLGYRWLMQHYDEGDEIYLFGFSRGALTHGDWPA